MFNQQIIIKEPNKFDKSRIISGITLRNLDYNPSKFGFSISKADILTDEETEQNRIALANQLNIDRSQLIVQKQIHSDISNVVSKGFPICESDGLITNHKNICLAISLADCCGILVFDPIQNIISAIHSGWKGTQQNIVGKTISKIVKNFSSFPSDFYVWITPCAGKEDYEVGEDVAQFFPNFIEMKNNGKYLLDLKSAIVNQLLNEGVEINRIEISPESTISDPNFHSYRRDRNKSGRMAAFIMMR